VVVVQDRPFSTTSHASNKEIVLTKEFFFKEPVEQSVTAKIMQQKHKRK